MTLFCALCLYLPLVQDGEPEEAVTVVNGFACCEDHLGFLGGGQQFATALNLAKKEYGRDH